MLRTIADKQFAHQELGPEEVKFLEEVIIINNQHCGAPPVSGWYPNLFDGDDAHTWVALVTDVHSDPSVRRDGKSGCVLHQGVGNVDLLVIAIDNGSDRMVYLGPVFSHYEFETPINARMTNGEWHDELRAGHEPPRGEWTRDYLHRGTNLAARTYGLSSPSP
jgi:hypothetical protein